MAHMKSLIRVTNGRKEGWSEVSLQWTHAESLVKYFRTLHLRTTTLEEIDSQIALRIDENTRGDLLLCEERFTTRFEVEAHAPSLRPILAEWIKHLGRA